MSRIREYERALTQMNIPQIPYEVRGGYGEPITLLTTALGIGASLFTNRKARLAAEEQNQAALDLAKDQMLIDAQIAKSEADASKMHAKNMPLYLLGGLGSLVVLALIVSKKKDREV